MASPLVVSLKTPGFIPFLSVAFINAVVDLGHKIIIQNTLFKIYDDAQQVALTAVINALILLPYILLFTPAGFLSDRFSKPKIMRWSAFSAILITVLITVCYYQGWFIIAFGLTFVLATQSAVYSPAKYGYVKELLGAKGLAAGNGYIQAITIIAILTGIFMFSILFEQFLVGNSFTNETEILTAIAPIGWVLVGLSVIEFCFARQLPTCHHGHSESFDWVAYTKGQTFIQNMQRIKNNRVVWYAILALALFWGISQTFLATFPAFGKTVLNEENTVVIQGLLACSGIGILLGSLFAGALKSSIHHRQLIKVGAIGMFLCLFILPHLNTTFYFAIFICLFGLFGGLYIVPLNVYIQLNARKNELGKVLAANNYIQNIFMVLCLVLTFLAASFAINSYLLLNLLPILTLFLAIILLHKFHPLH